VWWQKIIHLYDGRIGLLSDARAAGLVYTDTGECACRAVWAMKGQTMMQTYMPGDLENRMIDQQRRDAEREAERWRLSRLAHVQVRGWAVRQGCWLLCQLGRWLIQLGRTLQAYGAPQPA
jgi:hypothetical protein